MATLTEPVHAGEFLLSEGNGQISRENVTIAAGQNLPAGQVVGQITASGKYAAHDPGAADGTENAAGVLYAAVNAADGDKKGVVIARFAEVDGAAVTGDTDGLAALNIIVR